MIPQDKTAEVARVAILEPVPEATPPPQPADGLAAAASPATPSRYQRWSRPWKEPWSILWVCYTLLFLYALPLFVILATFWLSQGFSRADGSIIFSLGVTNLYASATRETLGVFVVPFVTAYAVAAVRPDSKLPATTWWLFLALGLLFLLAMFVYAAIHLRVDVLMSQTDVVPLELDRYTVNFQRMCEAYVKEILVYISLVIGVSQAGKAGDRK